MTACLVCGLSPVEPVYRSAGTLTVSSLCQMRQGQVEVWFCRACGHVQSTVCQDLGSYYDKNYNILTSSADEDHLYAVIDGKKVYRTGHQAKTLLEKVAIPRGAAVLDFGCAKAATLRRLCAARPDIQPSVFDVSTAYESFWREFVPAGQCASHELPAEWAGRFDVITSFFALEHVENPLRFCQTIASLLKPDGVFYCIIPNVFTNTADLVVDDHVNHFSAASLRHLLLRAGLKPSLIDDSSHASAWVVCATPAEACQKVTTPADEVGRLEAEVREMASFWSSYSSRIREFESSLPPDAHFAIYGSGFYGTMIASSLAAPARIACFMDQNPHLHGQMILERPIIAPEKLPEDVTSAIVGLNPKAAKSIISKLDAWKGRELTFFYP